MSSIVISVLKFCGADIVSTAWRLLKRKAFSASITSSYPLAYIAFACANYRVLDKTFIVFLFFKFVFNSFHVQRIFLQSQKSRDR